MAHPECGDHPLGFARSLQPRKMVVSLGKLDARTLIDAVGSRDAGDFASTLCFGWSPSSGWRSSACVAWNLRVCVSLSATLAHPRTNHQPKEKAHHAQRIQR